MNTKSAVVVGVLLVLAIGGGAWLVSGKDQAAKTEVPAVSTSQESSGSGTLFASIKDALSKSISLECNFTNAMDLGEKSEKKDLKVTAYIKNGAMRMHSATIADDIAQTDSDVIFKDEKMYIWSSKSGGIVMELPEIDAKNAPVVGGPGQNNGAEVFEELEKFKDSCKPAVVADSMFVPPSDVRFQDLTPMMQQLPSAVPTASVDPEEVKKLMEQYSGEQE